MHIRNLRVAVYSQDSLGLGHLRRTILIGAEILRTRPQTDILLITDSPAGPFFDLPEGMDHLKLPSIRKVRAGEWQATRLHMATPEIQRWRRKLLHQIFIGYRPDLVLVDHMPGGAQGELLPALQALKYAHPGSSVVFGLREILDAEIVIRRVWEVEGAYDALRRYYDRVLIYGCSSVFPTAEAYGIPEPPYGIHYCGYVVNRSTPQPAAQIRALADAANEPLVYVSAGGGGDSEHLMRTYLHALRRLRSRVDFTTLMAVGVNSPKHVMAEMQNLAEGLPVRVVSHVRDGFSAIAASDLVISMAGYNTLAEVLRLGKKCLVVPRSGPSAEQRTRARLFAKRQMVRMIDPAELTPETLAVGLLSMLKEERLPSAASEVSLCGAKVAAELTLELVEKKIYAEAI